MGGEAGRVRRSTLIGDLLPFLCWLAALPGVGGAEQHAECLRFAVQLSNA